jgi:hypothetical protein
MRTIPAAKLPHAAQVEMGWNEEVVKVTRKDINRVVFTRITLIDINTEERRTIYATNDGFVVSPVDSRAPWCVQQWVGTGLTSNTMGPHIKAYSEALRAAGEYHRSVSLIEKKNLLDVAAFITVLRHDYPQGA